MQAVNPRLLAFGGLIAMASAVGIGRFIYTPILPPMAEGLHLTKGEAGLIASANFLGYLAGALAASSPRLQGSPRTWLLGALAISAATTAAMSWPDSVSAFLALRFIGGVASAYVLVLASSLVLERLAAGGHGGLSAIHFSGVGTGIAVSALLTWALVVLGLDWRAMWLGGGLISLAGLAAVAALVPTATFIVVIVRGSPEAVRIEPAFWLAFGLLAIPSVAFWVAVGRRAGVMPAFAMACIVEAIGVYASVAAPNIVGLFVASALLGGTFMGLTALGLIAARDLAPADPRRWVGILTAAFGLGQIIGPLVAGYGFDLTGSFFLPSMLAVAALVVSASLALAIPRQR